MRTEVITCGIFLCRLLSVKEHSYKCTAFSWKLGYYDQLQYCYDYPARAG